MLNDKEFQKISDEAMEKARYEAIQPISFDEMESIFNKWLLIEDKGVLRLLSAVVIANKLAIDPVWVFLVAPSGGGKTELVQALKKLPNIFMLSSLTPQTLISGMKGDGKSLLFRITGKILVFKDFTTILSSHAEPQNEILGQLREIYDGHFRKEFGTWESQTWTGKIGFIAGVTSVIDKHTNVHKSLGERFLQYRIKQPDRKAVMKRIRENIFNQKQMREELTDAMTAYIKGVEIPDDLTTWKISDEVQEKIMDIADLAARIRSAVFRDIYSRDKEIIFVPEIEISTRIYTQLSTVAMGLLVINKGTFNKEDYEIVYKMALDSIHYLKMKVINALKQYKGWVKTSTLALDIDYSTHTTRGYLEELTALELVQRTKPRENLDLWRIRPDMMEMWQKSCWDKMNDVGIKEDEEAKALTEVSEEVLLLEAEESGSETL